MKKISYFILFSFLGVTPAYAVDYSLCKNVILERNLKLDENGRVQAFSPYTFSTESIPLYDVYTYKNKVRDPLLKIVVKKNVNNEITEINTFNEQSEHLGSSQLSIIDGKCVPVRMISYKEKQIYADFNLCREMDAYVKALPAKQKGVAQDIHKIEGSLGVIIEKYDRVPSPYSQVPLFLLGGGEFSSFHGGMYMERCRNLTDGDSYSRTARTNLDQIFALLQKSAAPRIAAAPTY